MEVYLVEVGVLEDVHYENGFYSDVYDKKHGYYDEGQCYVANKESAIKEAMDYVKDGIENTYGIVTKTFLDDSISLEELDEIPVEDETYKVEDVVFSVAKINGEMVQNFLENEKKEVED